MDYSSDFPHCFAKVIRHFTMAERLSGDSGSSVQQLHVSMIIDNTVTTSGLRLAVRWLLAHLPVMVFRGARTAHQIKWDLIDDISIR
jgi:hypothetical protein